MANVAVTNTTGLYATTSNSAVLNGAQQLLALLDNNGNVNFALDPATNYQTVYSYFNGNAGGGGGGGSLTLYGDVNAIGTIGTPIATVLSTTGVTAGTYGNATQVPSFTVDSKGRILNITSVNIAASGGTIYSNTNVAAYITVNGITTSANVQTTAKFIGDGSLLTNLPIGPSNYGNSNVAAYMPIYLPTYGGSLAPALIATNTYLWANGQPINFGTSSNYGNANVAVYLSSNTDPTISGLWANAVLQQSEITAANAAITTVSTNLTSFETYANANYATIATTNNLQTEITSNAALITGLQSQMTSNAALITGLQSQVTANAATLTATTAELHSFETYANATYGSQSSIAGLQSQITSNAAILTATTAELHSFETYGNATYSTIANAASLQSQIIGANAAIVTANTAVVAYVNTQIAADIAAWTANAASQEGEISGLRANIIASNTSIAGLQSQITSNAALITGLQSQMTSNAAIITATTNELHSYETYGNATYQTIAGLPTAISTFLPTYNGYVGGNITVGGNLTVQGNIISNNYDEVITGLLIANSTTPATSTTTGALQSYGGAGIQGALYAGSVQTNTYNYANGASIFTGINSSLATLQTEITSNAALITGLQSQMTSNAALITGLQTQVTANAATLSSFQTYANNTYATQTTTNNLQSQITSNAAIITATTNELHSYETYGNATYATQTTTNNLQSEITSNAALITGLQSQMTSNAALITGLQTQVTANAAILTATTAELHSFETYANATYQLASAAYGNANVASYLPTYTGNINATANIANNINIYQTSSINELAPIVLVDTSIVGAEQPFVNANIGGNTWTAISTTGGILEQTIYVPANNSLWSATNAASEPIQWSFDEGVTWNGFTPPGGAGGGAIFYNGTYVVAQDSSYYYYFNPNGTVVNWGHNSSIGFPSSNAFTTFNGNLISGGSGGVYYSTLPGGMISGSWNLLSTTPGDVTAFVTIGSTLFAATAAGIWKSTNGGTTWTVTSNSTNNFNTIYSTGSIVLAGAADNTGIWKSTDGGNTWAQTAQTTGYFGSFLNVGTKIYAANTNGGGVYVSTNNGGNWSQTGLTSGNWYSLVSFPDKTLVFGTFDGLGTDTYGTYNTGLIYNAVTNTLNANITGSALPKGPASGDLTGTYPAPALINTGVTAGVYGDTANVPQFNVDAKGRILSVSNIAISGSGGGYGNSNVAAYLPTYTGTIGNVVTTNGVYWSNGVSYASTVQGLYGNSNVAAYMPTYLPTYNGTVGASTVTNVQNISASSGTPIITFPASGSSYGNAGMNFLGSRIQTWNLPFVIETGTSVSDAVSKVILNLDGSIVATGNVYTSANFVANSGAYFIGDGSKLTNVTGNYGNTQVAVYLPTDPTITNLQTEITANAAILSSFETYANATYTIKGNLAGNPLFDSVNNRIFANAYPFSSMATANFPGTQAYSFAGVYGQPVYSGGVLQPISTYNGVSVGSNSASQSFGLTAIGNVALATASGSGRSTIGHSLYAGVTATGTMNASDRVRGVANSVDIFPNGYTWGVMNSSSQTTPSIAGLFGAAATIGAGNIASLGGGMFGAVVEPPTSLQGAFTGTANVQYATGISGYVGWNPTSTALSSTQIYPANIVWARALLATLNGNANGNLTITNAVGLHIPNVWASTGTITNKYSLLSEDTSTKFQHAGNLNVGSVGGYSSANTGFNSAGVFTVAQITAVTGVVGQFAAVSNGTSRNNGAMAYWDATNTRWSWMADDTAVS